jgi:hypothetical protein
MNNGFHLSDLWAVAFALVAFLILLNAQDLYESIKSVLRQGIRHYIAIRITSSGLADEVVEDDSEIEAENAVPVQFSEQRTPGSEAFTSQTGSGTACSAFSLTNDEIAGVRRMINYYRETLARGEQPTKSGAILAGFNRKRGGSAEYVRASDIYDALFGAPEPAVKFRPLTEDSKPVFQEVN